MLSDPLSTDGGVWECERQVPASPTGQRMRANGLRCWWAMQEPGQVYVIGAGDCGQLGVGEDDVEALRARLSPVASGAKARLPVAAS